MAITARSARAIGRPPDEVMPSWKARIREAFFAKRGSSDTDALRAFHDGITSSGGLPIALAERAVMAAA